MVVDEAMKKRIWRVCGEWVAIVVGSLLIALVLKATVVQTFYIPSGSMLPTLEIGDRIVVNKVAFKLGEVERSDLVVFSKPTTLGNMGINDFIKRVKSILMGSCSWSLIYKQANLPVTCRLHRFPMAIIS